MNLNRTYFLLALLIILLTTPNAFAQSSVYSNEVEDRIKKVERSLAGPLVVEGDTLWHLQERMAYHKIAAVSIAVVKNFKIDWARAYGLADIAQKRAANPSTRFQAASISKSINAISLLKLVQAKKIDLHANINNYLTSWKFPYDSLSNGKKISLANLLSHTGGLTVHGFAGYKASDKIPTLVEILNGTPPANSAAVRSNLEPGVKFVYSGGGTTISQLITMDLTKEPYADFVHRTVLAPLGMNHSFYYRHLVLGRAKDLATAYRSSGEEVSGKYHLYPEMAAAALWTTPTDLAKFIIETQLSLQGKSNKVLSKETTELMLTPYKEAAGFGVFMIKKGEQTYFSHSGANAGFMSIYYGSKDGGNGVVVMVNSDNGAIMQEIVNSVATVYDWKGFYAPVIKKLVMVPDDVSSRYVGKYQINPQFVVNITKENGQLIAQATGQGKLHLYAEAENIYFVKVADIRVEFVKNATGTVEEILIHQNGGTLPAKKL